MFSLHRFDWMEIISGFFISPIIIIIFHMEYVMKTTINYDIIISYNSAKRLLRIINEFLWFDLNLISV